MNRQEPPPFTLKSLAVWLALGLLGIGLAVAIALVARNLADQPVGIAGEPVSAGRALDPPQTPPSGTNSGAANNGRGSKDRRNERADGGQADEDGQSTPAVEGGASGGSPGGGSTAAPGTGSGSGDDSSSGGSDESHGDEGGGHDSDDD